MTGKKKMTGKRMKIFAGILAASAVLAMGVPGLPGIGEKAVTAQAAAAVSGKCGDNVTWKYDKKTKTLTLSGKGATYNGCYTMSGGPHFVELGFESVDIEHVVVEEGVTAIGDYLFGVMVGYNLMGDEEQSVIRTVTFPNSLTSIGKGAFMGTRVLSDPKFKLPANLKKIGDDAFSNGGYTKSVTSVIEIAKGSNPSGTLRIPGKVTRIGDGAFRGCTKLTLDVPDSVTYLGSENNVKEIKGNKSAYIAQRAEENGADYTGKVLSSKTLIYVKGVGGDSRLSLTNFSRPVSLDASVNSKGKLTYKSSDKNIVQVSSKGVVTVKGIGTAKITVTAAKKGSYAKASRTIAVTVKTQRKYSAFDKGNLSFEIIKAITAKNKTGTVKVVGISENVKGKERDALTEIVVPSAVKVNGFSYTVTEIGGGYNAWSGKNLKTVTVNADGLKEVCENAFYEAGNLEKIMIKSKVLKTIGNRAFCGAGRLREVEILSPVLSEIKDEAFDGCADPLIVKLHSTKLKKLGQYAFGGISYANVFVPKNMVENYRKLLLEASYEEDDKPYIQALEK